MEFILGPPPVPFLSQARLKSRRYLRGVRTSHIAIVAESDRDKLTDASVVEHQDGTLEFRFDGQRSSSYRDTVISVSRQLQMARKLANTSQQQATHNSEWSSNLWRSRTATAQDQASRQKGNTNRTSELAVQDRAATEQDRAATVQDRAARSKGDTGRTPKVVAAKEAMMLARQAWRDAKTALYAVEDDKLISPELRAEVRRTKIVWRESIAALTAAEQASMPKTEPNSAAAPASSAAAETAEPDSWQDKNQQIAISHDSRQGHQPQLSNLQQSDNAVEGDGHSSQAEPADAAHIANGSEEATPSTDATHDDSHVSANEAPPTRLQHESGTGGSGEADGPTYDQQASTGLRTNQSGNRELLRQLKRRLYKAEHTAAALDELEQQLQKLRAQLTVRIHNGKELVSNLEDIMDSAYPASMADVSRSAPARADADSMPQRIADSISINSNGNGNGAAATRPWAQEDSSLQALDGADPSGASDDDEVEVVWRSELGLSHEDIDHRAFIAAGHRVAIGDAAYQAAAGSDEAEGVTLFEMAAAAGPSLRDIRLQGDAARVGPLANSSFPQRLSAVPALLWLTRLGRSVVGMPVTVWMRFWWALPSPFRHWVHSLRSNRSGDGLHCSPSLACMLEAAENESLAEAARKSAVHAAGFDESGRWRLPGLPLADVPKYQLERLLELPIRDMSLFRAALTSPSALRPEQRVTGDFQRLEYLGDAVLGLVVRNTLMRLFPSVMEGTLTKLHEALVSGTAVRAMGAYLGLERYLVTNAVSMLEHGHRSPKLLADCTEALFGAVYLDTGLEAAEQLVVRLLRDAVRIPASRLATDRKALLYDACRKRSLPKPRFSTKVIPMGDGKVKWQTSGVIGQEVAVDGEPMSSRRDALQCAIKECLTALQGTSVGPSKKKEASRQLQQR